MIQIMFTCDRCKRKKELKGNTKEDSKEIYDAVIYHHGDRIAYTIPMIKAQLCPECEIELDRWLNGEKQTTRTDVSDKRADAKA